MDCVWSSLLSWVTRAQSKYTVFTKNSGPGTGLQQCIGSSHKYSGTFVLMPASWIESENERGYWKRNRIIPQRIVQNLGGDVKSYMGVCFAWWFFKKNYASTCVSTGLKYPLSLIPYVENGKFARTGIESSWVRILRCVKVEGYSLVYDRQEPTHPPHIL